MIVLVRKWVLKIAFALFRPLRVRPRVAFATAYASHLSGNLAFIRDELARQAPSVEVVVIAVSTTRGLLGGLRTLWGVIMGEYFLATSRVFIVDDYYFPLYVVRPKPETTVIQTWHASGAFKKVGLSVVGKDFGANESLVRQVEIHSNYDHILMGSKTWVPAYTEAFGQPAEKFVTDLGIPRTDLFFDHARVEEAIARVRQKYDLPAEKKVILYAPTFRGSSKNSATFKDDLDFELMRAMCGAEWVLLLRLHPVVAHASMLDPTLEGFVYDATDCSARGSAYART